MRRGATARWSVGSRQQVKLPVTTSEAALLEKCGLMTEGSLPETSGTEKNMGCGERTVFPGRKQAEFPAWPRDGGSFTEQNASAAWLCSLWSPWASSWLPLVGGHAGGGRDRKALLVGRVCSHGKVGACLFAPSSALVIHRVNTWLLLIFLESRDGF